MKYGVNHFEALLPRIVTQLFPSSAPAAKTSDPSNLLQLVRSRENQLKALGTQEHKLCSEIEECQVKLRSMAKERLEAQKLLHHYKSIGQEERAAFPGTPGGTNAGAELLSPWAPLKTQDGLVGSKDL